jgi:hypothetical protein
MITRVHQGVLYRIADRARKTPADDLEEFKNTAKEHAKSIVEGQLELQAAIDLLFVWFNQGAPPEDKLWSNIIDVQNDVEGADIIIALAATAWLRSELNKE